MNKTNNVKIIKNDEEKYSHCVVSVPSSLKVIFPNLNILSAVLFYRLLI